MFKKMLNISILVIAVAVVGTAILIFQIVTSGQRKTNLPLAELVLAGEAFSVEVANTALSRASGLSGRSGLGEREGMFFVFNSADVHGFWMKDMNFPIDIIWISGNRIVGFTENAQPEPEKKLWELKMYSPPEPVDGVLEVNAGTVQRLGLKVGDATKIHR